MRRQDCRRPLSSRIAVHSERRVDDRLHTVVVFRMASVLRCSNNMGYLPSSSSVQARDGCEVIGGRFREPRVMALLKGCREGTIPMAKSSRHPSRMRVKKGRHELRLDSSDYEAAEWVSRVIKDPMVEIDPITVQQQISADEEKTIDLLENPNVTSSSRVANDFPPSVASRNRGVALASSAAFAAAAMFAVVQLIRLRACRLEWRVIPGCKYSLVLDPQMTNHGKVARTEGCGVQSKVSELLAVPQFDGLTDDKTLSVASMHFSKLLPSEALEGMNYVSARHMPRIEVVEGFMGRDNSMKLLGEVKNSLAQVEPSCPRADMECLGFVASQQRMPRTLVFVVGDQNIPSTLKPGSRTIEGSFPSAPPTLSSTKPPIYLFEPPHVPARGNEHAKSNGLSIALDRKIQVDKRESLHKALQGAVPLIAIGGGAGGALAGVEGALEVVGLIATISFIWYELLWAKRRHQLWAELSAVSDHETLAKFFKSRKFTTDRQSG